MADEFGGIPIEESSQDEFGGIPIDQEQPISIPKPQPWQLTETGQKPYLGPWSGGPLSPYEEEKREEAANLYKSLLEPPIPPPHFEGETVPGKIAAGLGNVAGGVYGAIASPVGLATLPLAATKLGAPIVKGIFGGLAAKTAGEQLGEASVTGDVQQYTEGLANAALAGLISKPEFGRRAPIVTPKRSEPIAEAKPPILPPEEPAPVTEAKPEVAPEVPVEPIPEQAKPPAIKQPWQMTKPEFMEYLEKETGGRTPLNWVSGHRYQIDQAIKEGKTVPPEVLKDYPDLESKPSPSVPERVAEVPPLEAVSAREAEAKPAEAPAGELQPAISETKPEPEKVQEQAPGAISTPALAPSAPAQITAPIKGVAEIIRDLSKGLDIPIRFGRLTTTKYAGYFKKIPNLIGAKRANNLPVVAHEVGHKLDALYRISGDPSLVPELDALGDPARLGPGSSWTTSKSKSYKLGEGVAEFIRQWVEDPTRTASIAPNMHRYFETLLNSNHDLGRLLRQTQEDIRLWKTAAPLARLDSSIVQGEGPVKARYTISNLTRDLVDDLHFVKLAVEESKKTTEVPASKDPYVLARLLRGTFGMADTFIRKGVVDFKTKAVSQGTGLQDILSPVSGRINEFRRFIIAKRANELMSQGRNTGLQPGDVAEALRAYQSEPEFQATFDKLKQWNDSLLQYAQDSGMLKPETVEAMRRMNQDYVPFHRFFEIGAGELGAVEGAGTGRGLNVGKPGSLRQLKGSSRDIVDPLETMVRNAYAIITASEKNALNVALADLAEKPNMARWVERVRTPTDPHKVTMGDLRKDMEAMGADVSMIPDESEFTFFRRPGKTPYGENIIKVVRDGKAEYYRVNSGLYETFHALDYDLAGKFIRLISQPAQLLRAGVTLAPDFAFRNVLRDTFSSAVISRYSMIPFWHTAKGVLSLLGLRDPKIVSEWAASGGKQAIETTYFDTAKIQKFIRDKITKELSPADRVKMGIMSPLMALRRLTGLFEEGTRVGQYEVAYKALRQKGVPEGDARRMAAFEARDLQDFAMGGANTKPLRMMTPFWNAAMQGNLRLAKAFRERPVATIAKGIAYITLPKLMEQAINWNDPDYWDRPQWERDLFFLFPYGKDENGHTKFIRVPTPFEVGIIFGSFPGRILQWAKQHHPDDLSGFPQMMLGQMAPNPIPPWVMAFMELKAGKQGYSFWRGKPIVPSNLVDEAPELRYTEQNSLTARKIGKALGIAPAKVDYAIQASTGGIGRLLTHQASDRVIQAITGEKRTAENVYPGASLLTTPAGIQSDAVERFYKKLESAREDASRFKAGTKTTGEYLNSQKLEGYSRRLGKLRRDARETKDPVQRQRIQLEIVQEAQNALEE